MVKHQSARSHAGEWRGELAWSQESHDVRSHRAEMIGRKVHTHHDALHNAHFLDLLLQRNVDAQEAQLAASHGPKDPLDLHELVEEVVKHLERALRCREREGSMVALVLLHKGTLQHVAPTHVLLPRTHTLVRAAPSPGG